MIAPCKTIKVNINGSFSNDNSHIGIGGIFRDCEDMTLLYFAKHLLVELIIHAKILAIGQGFLIAFASHLANLATFYFKSDSSHVVLWFLMPTKARCDSKMSFESAKSFCSLQPVLYLTHLSLWKWQCRHACWLGWMLHNWVLLILLDSLIVFSFFLCCITAPALFQLSFNPINLFNKEIQFMKERRFVV